MAKLNAKMQERLDKWRKPEAAKPKMAVEKCSKRGGRGDFGDVFSQEQWEKEMMFSQNRR